MARFRRKLVRERTGDCCEYCHLPQAYSVLPHEVDHIRARKHQGRTTLFNTCWACAACNGAKGPCVASYDRDTGELVPLFNPRKDRWANHFRYEGPLLVGLTSVGSTTIDVLRINDPERVIQRNLLMLSGQWKPS